MNGVVLRAGGLTTDSQGMAGYRRGYGLGWLPMPAWLIAGNSGSGTMPFLVACFTGFIDRCSLPVRNEFDGPISDYGKAGN